MTVDEDWGGPTRGHDRDTTFLTNDPMREKDLLLPYKNFKAEDKDQNRGKESIAEEHPETDSKNDPALAPSRAPSGSEEVNTSQHQKNDDSDMSDEAAEPKSDPDKKMTEEYARKHRYKAPPAELSSERGRERARSSGRNKIPRTPTKAKATPKSLLYPKRGRAFSLTEAEARSASARAQDRSPSPPRSPPPPPAASTKKGLQEWKAAVKAGPPILAPAQPIRLMSANPETVQECHGR